MYPLVRPLLFTLDPERSHDLTLSLLRGAWRLPGIPVLARGLYAQRTPSLPVEAMGLRFPNPLGLAAGLDKEARCLGPLFDFGFGFLELGTVTPQAQPGNPKPRLFRLPEHGALINRMGFNSSGLDRFLANLGAQARPGLIGINIGKNKTTPDDEAINDYRIGMRAVYAHADYITLNISSPNTPGLRALQTEAALAALLTAIKQEQTILTQAHNRHVPIALKIAPDLDDQGIDAIAELVLAHRLDAVIATNTTLARPGLGQIPIAQETGGLSGAPLRPLSTQIIRRLYVRLQGRIAIIGVGGITNADDAWEKLVAGADLLQVYTAFIYQGPSIVSSIVGGLAKKLHFYRASTLAEALHCARASTRSV